MDNFYFVQTSMYNRSFRSVINPILNDLTDASRFYLNISRAFTFESYIPRAGEWSTPWPVKVDPNYTMPEYNPNFSKTFTDITDQTANIILDSINKTDKQHLVFYSGGIDSTTVLVSLLKNLTISELNKISVCMSADSIIENPNFYLKYIKNKLNVIDSNDHDLKNHSEKNCISIVADLGDGLFGTELGTRMYPQFFSLGKKLGYKTNTLTDLYKNLSNSDYHYSKYKNLIIEYFNSILQSKHTEYDIKDHLFGELYYTKLDNNIKTSTVPINSLHDFFWWIIFNVKFMHCALRPGTIHSTGVDRTDIFTNSMINWYGTRDYQLWSMANNNNGEKIKGTTQHSYKWAAKKYIYEFDKNDWYFSHKIKFASMPLVTGRNWSKKFTELDSFFALTDKYQTLFFGDESVDNYVREQILNYKIDWR